MTNLEIKVISGEYEIISTGIINLKNENFTIYIKNLKLDFFFKRDDSGKTHYNGEKISDTEIRFHVFNMQNGLLEGFYSPSEIGTIGGRKFYINFAAWSLDAQENIRTVVYNLLLSKETLDEK
ncbi:MAG: DUF6864 domain-containing function [Fibrobacter intestinalis]|uniref:DUF6864 domain-containing function n=1 Tax=Fibrobacter intestinalis TaxID=28122 RepID=UPI003F111D5E